MKRGENVPEFLQERFSITAGEHKLLEALDELSPRDTGTIYVAGNSGNLRVPTIGMLGERTRLSEKKVRGHLEAIRTKWHLPEVGDLPSDRGTIDSEEALTNTILNQHRLRWDDRVGAHRVRKVHVLSGEMGTGTLFTDNDAFIGEAITLRAMGLEKELNSVHIQGGIMPEMISLFGKAKTQRALLIGQDKSKKGNGDELAQIKQMLELGEMEFDVRTMRNLESKVLGTLGSLENAAKSVAHEMAPLLKGVPEKTPIHMYWSQADDANLGEIQDVMIASIRKIRNRMQSATKALPKLRVDLQGEQIVDSESIVGGVLGKSLVQYINRTKSLPERGQRFQTAFNAFFEDGDGKETARLKGIRERAEKKYFALHPKVTLAVKDRFKTLFNGAVRDAREIATQKQTRRYNDRIVAGHEKRVEKILSLERKISEESAFESALIAEQMAGHSWFTKAIALKPSEAKALSMVIKDRYKRMYTDHLIPKLKELIGEKTIHLHTDRVITVYVPDPAIIHGVEDKLGKDDLNGTFVTSNARTNMQRSKEPLLNSAGELQTFQASVVAETMARGKQRPTKVSEFNKRNHGFSDVYFTSYGADGLQVQWKFLKAPPRVPGEYRDTPAIGTFIKLPTRHDNDILLELMTKGNLGTWPAKRIDKGGTTSGNLILIQHPDRSEEAMFIDNDYYKWVGKKFGPKLKKLETELADVRGKLGRATADVSIKKHETTIGRIKGEIESVYEAARPEIKNILFANDLHLGSYSYPGRPSNIDGIRASQLPILQSLGMGAIDYGIMTEALHGKQAWRSYDSSLEGFGVNPVELRDKMNTLEKGMRENGASPKELLEGQRALITEFADGASIFRPEDQKDMFRRVVQPVLEELMDNGTKFHISAGNHWMGEGQEDEATVLGHMFDKRYVEQGLLELGKSSGQSFGYDHVVLPSSSGVIRAIIAHKMWHGKTEISQICKQATGTKEDARYFFTSDRHQPGMFAERKRMGVLDVGNQTVIPYVQNIGKASSVRGSMTGGYGANGEQIIRARGWFDPVVDVVSGWDERAGILRRSHSLIETANRNASVAKEVRQLNHRQGQLALV